MTQVRTGHWLLAEGDETCLIYIPSTQKQDVKKLKEEKARNILIDKFSNNVRQMISACVDDSIVTDQTSFLDDLLDSIENILSHGIEGSYFIMTSQM